MFAAQYNPGNKDLTLKDDYPVPHPGPGQVLVKVAACGVCHSDVAFIDGSVLPYPLVLGHEISGYVVKSGDGVTQSFRADALYAVLAIHPSSQSVNGLPALFDSPGAAYDGGFAEYILVRPDQLVPVPAGVSPELAAVAADAGINAYKFVVHSAQIDGTRKRTVLVIGVGGLGHQAVQIAAHFGATVYACDPKPEARELALKLGAVEAFSPSELEIKVAEGFVVNVAMDFVSRKSTFEAAKAILRHNNLSFPADPRLIVKAGMTSETLEFTTFDTLTYNLTIVTPQYGSRLDLEAILELYAKGAVTPVVSSYPLREVNKVLNDLRNGDVMGRIVVIPGEF
ncbi:N-benzyl-3-pyrrolidinol dehydrogenase [Mycena albidolilacea]|uniref:N-benzyl-3-pyrrolidinol dehydrogenase n=1 Tax=Mycena albidolilacea TaxID=1033008 RepID=A0AAD7ERM9_9AGAR|nr:N-benzyl-3-pyrrolidinol dehydrogenase [Mycena albidolilacea]